MKSTVSVIILYSLLASSTFAGLDIVRSNGITLTGADGIKYVGVNGITLTGADGILTQNTNGITLTGADGITPFDNNGTRTIGPSGVTYSGPNGITLTGADGITLTGADGITLTGADGITLTGADGTQYHADSIVIRNPSGITLTGADGITLTGADGITLTGADGVVRTAFDGITLTGADGITLTGADGITTIDVDVITLTGADGIVGFGPSGVLFDLHDPTGITLTGADGIAATLAQGITLTGADGIRLVGFDDLVFPGELPPTGLQSLDPELAIALNNATDDSSFNAVVIYHASVTESDLSQLQALGITGGTRFRRLPMVYVSATRQQLVSLSHLSGVRSIYGNRTLNFTSDPYFNFTRQQRVAGDADLVADNNGMPVTGRNVTVAVLDTGINSQHPDLTGKVVQNVRLLDTQSSPGVFAYPAPIENLTNSDPVAGHGTFVAGIVAGRGIRSAGKFNGVAPGANLLGLSAGDATLTNVLSGYDYLLEKAALYGVRVVNCSFSANTVFDYNDPVNIATKMLTDAGVNVVFSAGNSGPGNGSLNPYAAAPWVISVGATDQTGILAPFSSRGNFGNRLENPTLVAPGVNIVSVRNPSGVAGITGVGAADTQRLSPSEILDYTTASGTSFSAPQAAAAIALMLETNNSLSPAQVKDILTRTATPMPQNFYHEAGAGMLNTYAAVLESAFPARKMGTFRSTVSQNQVRFNTLPVQPFSAQVARGGVASVQIPVVSNTIQSSVEISWSVSGNDFGLKMFDSTNNLAGESNFLNLPGLTGLRERVVLNSPQPQTFRADIQHTAGVGTTQNVNGVVERTIVQYPEITDFRRVTEPDLAAVKLSLLLNLMYTEGNRFRPNAAASRFDLADSLLRAGRMPQYMASTPMFSDVRDPQMRNAIESSQTNPAGQLFYDMGTSGSFSPNSPVNRMVAAVAFVRAAGLENSVSTATLPPGVTDEASIPVNLRGYAAVAIQHGFLKLFRNRFRPNDSLARIDLAIALSKVVRFPFAASEPTSSFERGSRVRQGVK